MSESLPREFLNTMQQLLGAECTDFVKSLETDSPVSIRFNPFKITEKPQGQGVPWSRYGYYLDQRPSFTLDPLFHAGAYYPQEASSMFIEKLFRDSFDIHASVGESGHGRTGKTGLKILDLCAAPGGKTTLLSTLAGADSLIVANEVIRSRAVTLADNVAKWGVGNVVVTNNDPSHFTPFEHNFDMILLDVPCSGEGMFRKNSDARSQWSESNVKLCAQRARRIVSDVWGCLKPGGVLIFSTCTFNTEENEQNVEWINQQFDCEPINIDVDPAWGIVKTEVEGINTFRFYPHKVNGEGFFSAVIRKGDGKLRAKTPKPRKNIFSELSRRQNKELAKWFNQSEYMNFRLVADNVYAYYGYQSEAIGRFAESLSVIYSGVRAGQLFGDKLKPDHPLALFHDLNRDNVAQADLNLEQSLAYLRKGDIDAQLLQEGMNLITFDSVPVGWAKRIGQRVNNLYPKELRILNL